MRSPEWGTYAGAVTAFVYAVVWVGLGVFVWARFAGESFGAAVFAVAFIFGGGLCLVIGVRILRAGLWIDATAVTVRGVTRTTFVPLRAAEAFAPRDLGMGGAIRTTVGVTLRRRRERDLIVWAMRHGEFTRKSHREKALAHWQPVCEELNALLASFPGSAVHRPSP